ncbi:MAG TPA: HAMP domain-containing sensor histidine kinase [Gaiellaceae bacterium]|jgi:two-component system sensor histidine kinase MprB|nr:HAMP domain-containing sensor histidine kinase [Gaiellaceae bacterium]
MSFRARIALAAAVSVALVVVVTSALAYVIVQNELQGNIESSLRSRMETAQALPGLVTHQFFDRYPRPTLGGAPGYLQLVIFDGGVFQVFRPGYEETPLFYDQHVKQVATGAAKPYFRDTTVAGTAFRVYTAHLGTNAALQIGLEVKSTNDLLTRLGWILFAIAGAGVGAAVALGLLVARTALAPVRRLTAATEEITETRDLSRRVEAGTHDELGRLGTSFNTMLAALEESQQAQRQLVADASHELRTPLTSLRTNVELLARGTLPEDERKKAFADVMTQLEELTALVTDVVEVARDGEPQLTEEDVRLDLLVGDAVERARLHTPKVRFYTELHESLVRGVPDRIFRAVSNVLDNAAKWSPADGNVGVRVEHGEVTVRDQGPGIAPEDLPHVFDRFYRSPAARGTPGSGLGLAIVRQVVETHGGTVTAGPAEGGGTVVRLAFPNGNEPSS